MASFAPMRTGLPPQTPSLCAGTTPFEVGVRPRCSRSSRGRPQQCARSAARTSSSRFASRGSSAGSRSSGRSRRPSSEVELRAPTASVYEPPSVEMSATSFVSGILSMAMDDIATEMDFFTNDGCTTDSPTSEKTFLAEQVLCSAEPTIVEETEENEEAVSTPTRVLVQDCSAFQLDTCLSDSELECCDMDSDVCSVVSDNPDGVEEVDDMLVAMKFAKVALSDDTIREAFACEDLVQEAQDENEDLLSDDELMLDFACGILDQAKEGFISEELAEDPWQDEEVVVSDSEDDETPEHVEFLGETAFYGEELAFDFASSILDGAVVQASSTWQKQEEVACAQAAQNLESIKEKARQMLLKVALDKCSSAASPIETPPVANMESLKQTVRDCLLRAAQAKVAEKASEDLRHEVRETLVQASTSGELARVLGQAMQKTQLREVLIEAEASGKLQAALRQVTEKTEAATESEQPSEVAEAMPPTPTSKERTLSSSRSRRRIIGGVVRAPAVEHDMGMPSSSPRKRQSKSNQGPASFRMDFAEDESMSGRASSLTRSYDTLGVQFYSLADADEPPSVAKASPSSGRKPSKARAKMQAAGAMSAMAMDLEAGRSSASCPTSAPKVFSTFQGSFAPMPLNAGQKMRPSSSLGSLNLDQKGSFSFVKAKQGSGSMLPSLAPEKNSAESIAWSMQVSKTHSNAKWRNTGLRGSASMIF